MTRGCSQLATVGLALSCAAAGVASASEAPCKVEAIIEPADPVVGQQILWRALISRREDAGEVRWEQPPRFPGLRAEWLPGRVEDTRSRGGGASYRQREDQRALFAPRAGLVRIPAATLLCDDPASPGVRANTHRVVLPESEFRVSALPGRDAGADAPPEFRGLIGPVTVQTHVDRDRIELGESLRVSVMLRGATNLWDAPPPLRQLDTQRDLEVFREASKAEPHGGDRLYVQRPFRIDLVPRTIGVLRIPETQVDFYDPVARRYAVARAPAIAVQVVPRSTPEVPESERLRAPPPNSEPGADYPTYVTVALLLAAVIAATAFAWWRRWSPRFEAVDDAMHQAELAERAGDPRATAAACTRALRAALELAAPNLSGAGGAALRRESEELIAQLDRCRFAPDAEAPDRATVETAIAALKASTRSASGVG